MAIRLTSYMLLPPQAYPPAVVAGDIDLPMGMQAPEVGIVALHGLASATEALSRLRKTVTTGEWGLRTIELDVELGKSEANRFDLNRLRTSRVVHLGRLDKAADNAFFQMMKAAAEARGEAIDDSLGVSGGIVRRPHLIPDVVRAEKLAAEVISFDVEDPDATYRRLSVAILLSAEHITSASVRGLHETEVLWPEKLPMTLADLHNSQAPAQQAAAPARRRKKAA